MGPRDPRVGDTITLGEIYRAVQATEDRLIQVQQELRKETYALHSRMGDHATKIALVEQDVFGLKAVRHDVDSLKLVAQDVERLKLAGSTLGSWIVGGLTALLAGALEWIVHGLRTR